MGSQGQGLGWGMNLPKVTSRREAEQGQGFHRVSVKLSSKCPALGRSQRQLAWQAGQGLDCQPHFPPSPESLCVTPCITIGSNPGLNLRTPKHFTSETSRQIPRALQDRGAGRLRVVPGIWVHPHTKDKACAGRASLSSSRPHGSWAGCIQLPRSLLQIKSGI